MEILDQLEWRLLGPHRGGRVVAVTGDPSEPSTFYFGACAGGVWRSDDAGTTWRNISDGYFRTAAVGAVAVAASDPNVLYVGTGESTIRGDVSHGDGVYKSDNRGRTWHNVGLRETRHIGRIVIHPDDPDVAYVGAFGHAWEPNPERGVYRTRDGGRTWELILHVSERAGVHDIAMDAHNPRILFAAAWQAQRYPHALSSGGPQCGVWRSADGGDSWQDVSRRPGLPGGLLGKIGVAMSPARPGRVWALVEADDGALFRSDDCGEHWVRLSEEPLLRTRPWYYMHVTADPVDPDTVYVQNYGLWRSIDAGRTFAPLSTPHGDEHALWIDPRDPRRMVKGDDGGCAVSVNGGVTWSSQYTQPTAQIYHVTTDERVPYRVYGSQQDNTAISLPSLSVEGALHERDWYAPGGGESGYIAIKPDDPDIVVASGPAGRRAFNDVMTVYDHRTGQRRNITVWPELYGWGVGAGDLRYRFQWTFPILFSRHDPDALYVAGNRVFLSRNLGQSWTAVSPDLTRNDPERLGASGGPITRDNTGAEVYCTIFALDESPLVPGLWWAGSDDGRIHVSDDNCASWRDVTPPEDVLLPWALISIIEPSPHDPDTAYVAATRYKQGDNRPYLLETNDRGRTWRAIHEGLPTDDFTRVIRADPECPALLLAGTETGVHARLGGEWRRLGGNLPVVPVHDLRVRGADLLVATHGRSFWCLDDLGPLRSVAGAALEAPGRLFPPKAVLRLRTYGGGGEVPEPGMVDYLGISTSRGRVAGRWRADGRRVAEGLDVALNPPSGVTLWYALSEAAEAPAKVVIVDAAEREVRTFNEGPAPGPGLHRLVWNLRLPGVEAVRAADLSPWDRPQGPRVLPGTYGVRLRAGALAAEAEVRVLPDPRLRATDEDLAAQFAFLVAVLEQLSLCNRTLNALDEDRGRLAALAGSTPEGGLVPLLRELDGIRGRLIDVHMRGAQLWPSGIHEKLNALFGSADSADAAPSRQEREVFEVLKDRLAAEAGRYETLRAGPLAALWALARAVAEPIRAVTDQTAPRAPDR